MRQCAWQEEVLCEESAVYLAVNGTASVLSRRVYAHHIASLQGAYLLRLLHTVCTLCIDYKSVIEHQMVGRWTCTAAAP